MPNLARDPRYLKSAMLVAEQRSFRRAAMRPIHSQSNVSGRSNLLERRLGVILFERDRSGARSTSACKQFMRDAAIAADPLTRAIKEIPQGSYKHRLRSCEGNYSARDIGRAQPAISASYTVYIRNYSNFGAAV